MLWVLHSFYSLMWGVNSPEVLCRRAAERGHEVVVCADRNGLYGLVRFLSAVENSKIRLVVGAHLIRGNREMVVLVKSPEGYPLLCSLISQLHQDARFSFLRCFPEAGSRLAVVCADPELLRNLSRRVECHVAVPPGPRGREALRMAWELDLPSVAVFPVYFADPEDFPVHRLLRAIDTRTTLSTLPSRQSASPDAWLQPFRRTRRRFPHCPEALARAEALVRSCQPFPRMNRTVFPRYQGDRVDHFDLLLKRCRRGIRRRYGRSFPSLEQRLRTELDLIRSKGYVDYFLVVAGIAKRRPIRCGRGSAAASLVSYLLEITHVDPLRHRLAFERFLTPNRKDFPDIDVDFPWDERDELLKEVEQAYGPERFAMVANHVGFKGRAAIRETAKVFGIPEKEIREVTRRLSSKTSPRRLWERVASHPAFRGFHLSPVWRDIFRLAARLEGIPRHLSVHCGGVVLVPDRVDHHVPVEPSAKGVRIIQWEKDQAEESGLVKIDLLGNRSLAVIRDALAMVEESTGRRIDYASLDPLEDPKTQALLARGETLGIFYVESPAMRQLQQKTKRGDFRHLVIHSSIIRPAANRYIDAYIQRLRGAPYRPLHPDLEELLKETHGILVYQEDVVRAAMVLAGFDWDEADGLRKVLSKKSRERLEDYRRRFEEGCARRGVSPEVIRAVWDMFTSFAGYSFCKAHSASYALVSFKSAWLKVHYPAEFMAAVLANGGGYYTTSAYLSEARRLGLRILGPDVNRSRWKYWGKGSEIRMGLQQLRGIRRETLKRLLRERDRGGPYESLEDLFQRVSIQTADGIVLAKSGALDSLAAGMNRSQLLWWIQTRAGFRKSVDKPLQTSFGARKEATKSFLRTRSGVPPLPAPSAHVLWRHEKEALGLVYSVHPLKCYESAFARRSITWVEAKDLRRMAGRTVWLRGWPVARKEVMTREGSPMAFVSFEDESAIYETVFFPKAYERFCRCLDRERPYLLRGTVETPFGAVNVDVSFLDPVA